MALTTIPNFARAEFEDTCKRRFFYGLAFDPYGGTAGLYDMGPPMTSMKSNILQFWRQHFVLEENMQEIDTTCTTPQEIFVASGHVERFNDVMTKDSITGECFRLDKFIEEWVEKQLQQEGLAEATKKELTRVAELAGNMTLPELADVVKRYKIVSPKGNALSEPFPFNLMFSTQIGPEAGKVGYLRPELAQGIFMNFKRLLDTGHASRLPFAAACIGSAFRNEIAPRCALLRVREFTLAEIEHFVNPNDKRHPKFSKVADVVFTALPRENQMAGTGTVEMTIGEAVEKKVIDNETLAYFVARTLLFLQRSGMKYVRFRQHMKNEMAHYAQDCWDAECLTSYGWVECVGIADRSAFDLTCHSRASGKELNAREDFSEPQMQRVLDRKINKALVGKAFGKETAAFVQAVNALPAEEALAINEKLDSGNVTIVNAQIGKEFCATRQMVTFSWKTEKVTGYNYTPSVIEPSFGIGRILYSLLEQSYWVRRDETGKNEKRAVFSLSPLVAPVKVAILPLMVKPELEGLIARLKEELVVAGISNRVDDSGAAIGRKYARVDELGAPFCITCDFEKDGCVTLRERDTAKQVRVPIDDVARVIESLCRHAAPRSWDSVVAQYPEQKQA